MTLDLKGKTVVLIRGRQSVGRAIAEAVAHEGPDIVIWLRKGNDELNGMKVLPITQIEVPNRPNGTSARVSLWRETMARKSYW